MAADKDSGKNIFGRPRRSSFVAPADGNSDFMPGLPPVGSAPIPAAADVNYFPTVATGQPSIREPELPQQLVVPTRKSMTEEEIANAFVDASEMTSADQIAMLDAQVTLRQDDLRTAKEFVAFLRSVNPAEARPLLDELKARYADVDPKIADLTLDGSAPPYTRSVSDDVVAALVARNDEPKPDKPSGRPAPGAVVTGTSETVAREEARRYKGWSAVLTISALVALLVPVSSAVFTAFGSPVPDKVESLLGASGAFVTLLALLVALPLLLLARSVSARRGITWTAAIKESMGNIVGSAVSVLSVVFVLLGTLSVFLNTSQGIGIQLTSVPGVTSALAAIAPQAHAGVIVATIIIIIGFVIAALPRRVFRGFVLALAGFMLTGPAIVLLTGLAVVATTDSGVLLSLDNIVIATGILPIAIVVFAGLDSGIATAVRRDDVKLHGLWLFIGIAAGLGFAAWDLLSGMGGDLQGSLFVGSNPVLHVVAPSNDTAFMIGAVAFTVPLVFLAALVGRSVMMATTYDDRKAGNVGLRIAVIAVPVLVLVVDDLGVAGDVSALFPGVAFVSIPLMVVVGVLAGASIAGRRALQTGAQVTNGIIAVVITALGLVATSWSVPSLLPIYNSAVAPMLTTAGLSGTMALAIPAGVLVIAFAVSLVISAVGSVRPNRSA